jgi:hypothetical protein
LAIECLNLLANAKLQQIEPSEANSAQVYISEFIERSSENTRLPVSKVYSHYERWAKRRRKFVIEKRRFSALLSKQFHKSIYEGQTCFQNAVVRGENLHTFVRQFNRDLGFDSPADLLRAFLLTLEVDKIQSNDLWRRYCEFCRQRNLQPVKRTTMGRMLIQLGVVKRRMTNSWGYYLENFSG